MPQKKNPDVAELTRGKTGRLYGNLIALLTTMKGLPMTYNRDMQEDKEPVFDSVDTVKAALEVVAAMFGGIGMQRANCAAAVDDASLMATDLADYLVKKGVPFRKAHEIVGKSVARCAEKNTGLRGLSLEDYRALSPEFGTDVFEMLDANKSLAARQATGAPSPANVAAQLAKWRGVLKL